MSGSVAATQPVAAAAPRGLTTRRQRALIGSGCAVFLTAFASTNGGYFPTSWNWSTIVLGWAAVMLLVLRRELSLSRLELAFFATLCAFATWTWLSAIWSIDMPDTILEGQRLLVYVTAVAVMLLAVDRGSVDALLGGCLVGIVLPCLYGLATRLLPDQTGSFNSIAGYRLDRPLGYWNSEGLYAAMGVLLAFGFAVRARTLWARALAAASLLILLPTLAFTFSRGAWLALGIGLVFAVAVDPRRAQLVAFAIPLAVCPAVAVWLGLRSHALTTVGATLGHAAAQGHRLAFELLALAVTEAAMAAALVRIGELVRPGRRAERAGNGALVGLTGIAIAIAIAAYGSPVSIARRVWHEFVASSPGSGANLTNRLFSLSGNGRILSWRAAVHEFESSPLLGRGAGSFETWWYQYRPQALQIVDAHSLYLQTLGELGVVGGVLLVVVICLPIVGAWRMRRHPLVPVALGGFVAYAVHATVDWDWQVSAVTVAALVLGVASISTERRAPVRAGWLRWGAVAVAVSVAAFAVVALVGNTALSRAQSDLAAAQLGSARPEAQTAASWAPWASEPLVVLGGIEAQTFDAPGAQRSLRRAIGDSPRDYLAWYALAQATHGSAQRAAAQEVVRLNPLSDEAQEMRVLLRKGSSS